MVVFFGGALFKYMKKQLIKLLRALVLAVVIIFKIITTNEKTTAYPQLPKYGGSGIEYVQTFDPTNYNVTGSVETIAEGPLTPPTRFL